MSLSEIIGVWIATYFTLAILSFLYKDNPLFKIAESIFVGATYGYSVTITFFLYLKPKFFEPFARLIKSIYQGSQILQKGDSWIILIPTILGVLLLFQLVPRYSWLARYVLAFIFGVGVGQGLIPTIKGFLFKQIEITMQPLVKIGNGFTLDSININLIIIFIGVISVLAYFFFSFERKGVWKNLSTVGLYFLLISFGAAYGYTVMARETLLIGRIEFLFEKSLSKQFFYPIVVLVLFIVYFTYTALKEKKGHSTHNSETKT